jgi:hypothetical protein
MISVPNGYNVIAQRPDGFVAVHRLSGKAILGRTATDRFGNDYVVDTVEPSGGNLFGAISGWSKSGSTERWRELMASLMADLVQRESQRIQAEQYALGNR